MTPREILAIRRASLTRNIAGSEEGIQMREKEIADERSAISVWRREMEGIDIADMQLQRAEAG